MRAVVDRLRVAGLRAAVPVEALRVAAGLEAFARVVVFFAVERLAAGFFALERFVVLAAACGVPSSVHLPDRTRCAASAPFQQGTHLLQNAQRSISAPHTQAACGQLQAFINQVAAQAGKQLADDVAASWIASADAARVALGCN